MFRSSLFVLGMALQLSALAASPLEGVWEYRFPESPHAPFNAHLRDVFVIGDTDWTAATLIGKHNQTARFTYRLLDASTVTLTDEEGKTQSLTFERKENELEICNGGECLTYRGLSQAPALKTGKHPIPKVTGRITTTFDGKSHTQTFTAVDMEQLFPDHYQEQSPGVRTVDVGMTDEGVYQAAIGSYLFGDDPEDPASYGAVIRMWYGLKDKSHVGDIAASKGLHYLTPGIPHHLETEHEGHKLSFTLELELAR